MKILLIVLLFLFPVLTINSQTVDILKNEIVKNDTTLTDTTITPIDSLKLAKARPLTPLYAQPLLSVEDEANIISHPEIIYYPYSYAGDLLEQSPFTFQRHLGVMGQPHEVLIYGNGFRSVSYLMDGMLLNSRLHNSLDLNFVQTEAIDSVEVIPSPRAFLYGTFNNPSAVNFVPREDFTIDSQRGTYSRFRYYQAPNEEAMIDAIYRTYFSPRITGLFEMTNYSSSDRFPNTGHGSWKLNTALSYLFNDNFNLKGSYNYNRTETRLFGGVLSLEDTVDIPELSELTAPVNNPTRYQKYHQHQFNLTLRNKDVGSLTGKFDFYYINSLTEQRENERDTSAEAFKIIRDIKYKVYGALLDQRYSSESFNIFFNGNYEHLRYTDIYLGRVTFNSLALSGRGELKLLNDKLRPSVFAKYLAYDDKTYNGYGADAYFRFNPTFLIYAGLSGFTTLSIFSDKQTINSYEAGAEIKTHPLKISIKAFNQSITKWAKPGWQTDLPPGFIVDRSTSGLGLDLTLKFWKIYLEAQTTYYNVDFSGYNIKHLPELNIRPKLYFQDTLFKSNLFLRTGVQGKYISQEEPVNYSFFNLTTYYYEGSALLDPVYTLDFFLVGEIRERAIIYFTFENLFDKVQTIVPGYPLARRGLRIGFAWEFLN